MRKKDVLAQIDEKASEIERLLAEIRQEIDEAHEENTEDDKDVDAEEG